MARARVGDLCQANVPARAAAWAQWSIGALTEMSGLSDREYVALTLPGRFYDTRGRGPVVRPHLEIRDYVLARPAPEFPDRLALIGNGLTFPWWVFSEVTAVRRALFNTGRGDITGVLDRLTRQRPALEAALTSLTRRTAKHWAAIEGRLVTDPDGLVDVTTGDFDATAISALWPAAAELGLEVHFDTQLREKSGSRASRRVGVWQITAPAHAIAIGVITPRLTANSLFVDPLFAAATESPAALLVRALVLARLLEQAAPDDEPIVALLTEPVARQSSFLRAQPARVGARLPEASVEGAVAFLQQYSDSAEAWRLLSDWATRTKSLLTVSEDGFRASHANALRYVRRAEDPDRDDINVVLPLAWHNTQVVRVTFTRASDPAPE